MRYRYQLGDQIFDVVIERQGTHYEAVVDGERYECEVLDMAPGQISLRFFGQHLTLFWAEERGDRWISLNGCTYRLQRPVRTTVRPKDDAGRESIRSPMPAQVLAVQTGEGEKVEKGQTLLLLEAMKMEIRIKAPVSGQVVRLLVNAGETVDKDQLLAEVL